MVSTPSPQIPLPPPTLTPFKLLTPPPGPPRAGASRWPTTLPPSARRAPCPPTRPRGRPLPRVGCHPSPLRLLKHMDLNLYTPIPPRTQSIISLPQGGMAMPPPHDKTHSPTTRPPTTTTSPQPVIFHREYFPPGEFFLFTTNLKRPKALEIPCWNVKPNLVEPCWTICWNVKSFYPLPQPSGWGSV